LQIFLFFSCCFSFFSVLSEVMVSVSAKGFTENKKDRRSDPLMYGQIMLL